MKRERGLFVEKPSSPTILSRFSKFFNRNDEPEGNRGELAHLVAEIEMN